MSEAMRSAGATTPRQYWVIGGEFRDTRFDAMSSRPEAQGPFASYEEAFKVWQDRSNERRSEAHVRYMIAANPSR